MHRRDSRKGFTLVELSLSIVFISTLTIAVALIVMDSISSYRRGLTLNQINTVGMEIVDDMRASIKGAQARSLIDECGSIYTDDSVISQCVGDKAKSLMRVVRRADVTTPLGYYSNVPVFGAFCTGNYSYIWNSGYFFEPNSVEGNVASASLKYRDENGNTKTYPSGSEKRPRLLKVRDEKRDVCVSAIFGNANGAGNYAVNTSGIGSTFDLTPARYMVVDEPPVDLISGNAENNLAVYDLTPVASTEDSMANSIFYSVSFVLGTVQGGINVKSTSNYCTPPGGYSSEASNFDYCAINKFNFAAQASGG